MVKSTHCGKHEIWLSWTKLLKSTTNICHCSGVRFLFSWILVISTQRHILRERRPSATACPDCWAMETHKVKKCAVRKKKYFVLGLLEQLRQDKNLLNRHDSPSNQPRKDPFHLWTIIPHLTQFQQSAVSVSTPQSRFRCFRCENLLYYCIRLRIQGASQPQIFKEKNVLVQSLGRLQPDRLSW
jgi:hypothetical protein